LLRKDIAFCFRAVVVERQELGALLVAMSALCVENTARLQAMCGQPFFGAERSFDSAGREKS
jgi:hypothetical protein